MYIPLCEGRVSADSEREGSGRGVGGGRGDVQPQPIPGVSFIDWPPFTGC